VIAIVKAPQINANDDKVGVVGWHVEDGAYVAVGDDLVDLETSKAVVTIPADAAGFVRRVAAKGAIVNVGSLLCHIAETAEEATIALPEEIAQVPRGASVPSSAQTAPVASQVAASAAPARGQSPVRFSKGALDLIEALGIDKQAFDGAGLVTARSIEAARNPMPAVRADRSQAIRHAVPLPAPSSAREEMISLGKRAEIDALSTGEAGLINSTLSVFFDSAAIRSRLQQSDSFGGSIQPIILYEVSRLLQQWPQFTAFFADDRIHFYSRIDLGVALDLGRGLKVVTINDAQSLMPVEIFERTIEFGLKYNDNKIRPEELIGSTFTVTDLSGFDVLHFKPLINGRQSAILGIGGDGEQPGHPMSLNLTFDHRVANGREAAMFLQELRARISSYAPGARPSVAEPGLVPEASRGGIGLEMGATVHCARCGIDHATYRSEAGADAYMFACFSDAGNIEAVCHRCSGGFV
jgi:pyruvate/2-oxoglutarate dehydrogenase complex dihydrolipoamide acyltransferase (E2) component